MSDVIYSSKLVPSSDNSKYVNYFAIPVSIIKVMMTISKKPELNHFERAIISLLLKDYYSVQDLSDTLLLKKDLVELIIHDLEAKEFIDSNYKVTEKGEAVIQNVFKELKQEVCYLFFDYNRGCLLSTYSNGNDIVFGIGKYNDGAYSFILDGDEFREEVAYKFIKTEDNNKKFDVATIEKIVSRDIFNKTKIENLVNVKVVDISGKRYHLISEIETYSNYKGTKWIVKNPITLENDDGLYDFIYTNSTNDSIKELIRNIMQFRVNSLNDKDINKTYNLIKDKLFNKPIKDIHEDFILPLISVINVLNESKNKDYNVRVHRNEIVKVALLNLGDLYEKVLFQAAISNSHRHEFDCLGKDVRENKIKLKNIAAACGFDVSENGERILNVTNRSLRRIIMDPNKAQLAECLCWNLVLTTRDSNFYLSKLSKKYPNFINLMYQFKRDYRDESKHTVNVYDISPKCFIDLLFDVLEYAFGYKVNQKILNEIINYKGTICDYAFTEELIRTELGNKIFDSSSKELNELKFNLISMYDAYVTESSSYLSYAYPILDDIIKRILISIKSKYKCSYSNIHELFESTDKIYDFLVSIGFIMDNSEEIGNKIIDSLDYIGVEANIEKGFSLEFKDSVLRVKVLALIVCMAKNRAIAKEFIDKGLDDLFVITSTLSYLQRHQQVHVFNDKHAKIIVDNIIKIIDFIVNKSDLIKW